MRSILCAIGFVILLGACAKKQPASKPVVVEDVLPFGTDVCFPTGMKNESDDVGSAHATDAPAAPATPPAAPEVPR